MSIKIAEKIKGEIISADSRAIYKGMDIGTAKPSKEEQKKVPHWGIDLVEPGERFTAADWKKYAEAKIEEIRKRGHVPMVVGGTGLYIDALIYNYQFNDVVQKSCSDREKMRTNYLLIGVQTTPEKLRQKLQKRVNKLFTQELYDETQALVDKYGWDNQAMTSNIYQYAWKYMQGEMLLAVAKERCFYEDWHLAKRQMTWFKRNKKINWMELADIPKFVLKYIQDE